MNASVVLRRCCSGASAASIAEHSAGGSALFTLGPVPGRLRRLYVEASAMSELEGREIIFSVGFGLGGRVGR